MPATVRTATADDARQIAEIIDGLLREQISVTFDRPWTPQEVQQWMDRQGEQGTFLVVEDGGQVLGFATVDFNSAAPDAATFGAWIRADHRRKGYGSALAEHALAFARSRGYRRILARLPRDNEPALSYLSSIGALVPLLNPGATFELPIYQEGDPTGDSA